MIFQSIAFIVLFGAAVVEGAAPVVLPFNDTHSFGFDGPWQAVPILVGKPQQLVNLYPGGGGHISLLSRNAPADFTGPSYEGAASGVYDASVSQRFTAIAQVTHPDSGWGAYPTLPLVGKGARPCTDDVYHENFGTIAIVNTSLGAIVDASYQLPDGRKLPLDVGFLSLGGGLEGSYGTTIPTYLFAEGVTRSNTWGLHIGSVRASIPGSLVFGGYDMGRVIGDVRASEIPSNIGAMFVSLLDISIGVARGFSPFSFQEKHGLLLDRENKGAPLLVRPNPTVPYLHLPKSTCESIAALLPVKFSPSLGLYLWDTTSPQYERIISSPTFMAFAFEQVGSVNNFTIKVPFYLLNVTLSPPLVPEEVAYFPCRPFDFEDGSQNTHHLGRAFLQAAFIGMNWNTKAWWMAQAPGPKLPPATITSLENLSSTISAKEGQAYWTSSWDNVWSPLTEESGDSADDTLSSPPKPSGLSPGAKAGISLAALATTAMIAGTVIFLLRRLRKRRNTETLHNVARQSPIEQDDEEDLIHTKAELPSTNRGRVAPRHEMPVTEYRHEMFASTTYGRQQQQAAAII